MRDYVADRPKALVEAYKGRDPRLIFFYFALAAGLCVLASGLAYRQLVRRDVALEKEKIQSQIRVVVPGPRGNLYDRNGNLLVGNRARFSVVLNLEELRREFKDEYITVRLAYREANDKDLPTDAQLSNIARHAVVDRYLQQVNRALRRDATLDAANLRQHFRAERLLPFTLIDDLQPEEYSRLLEQLPVNSPMQVFVSSARYYPYGPAAAHVLGYVGLRDDVDLSEDFPGADLQTFKMKGSVGRDGLELRFDEQLQGEAGGTIYRIDPARYRVEALAKRLPVQGNNIVSSLDIDLQLAAENALKATELKGAAVVLDVHTGEILALASNPAYDLNLFAPRLSKAAANEIEENGAWLNRAIQGAYPPGSAFKILVSVAGMRAGVVDGDSHVECRGGIRVGNRFAPCNNHSDRGEITLRAAIAKSCNVFFYEHGIEMGPDVIAAEARRFGFGQRTGIELPNESGRTLVPDPQWKRRTRSETWTGGDTTNYSIGQGDMLVTPLQMATFAASIARGQTRTTPTLIHDPNRPPQRSEPIGLSAADYAAIVQGMEECTLTGSAKLLSLPGVKIPDLRIAGKTGTAQAYITEGKINLAWFICFAPVERPQIALAIVLEGTAGEDTGGGRYAAPAALPILKAWHTKQAPVAPQKFTAAGIN
ncbi:MAG TPA: penicillin-binding transpeptidase domain-containing protein [Candidatus Synoicihabitans sp.]|nr:penicillin-binding transpeptidase domain-containing protein [Candidatus Synoicihabitans sp.]